MTNRYFEQPILIAVLNAPTQLVRAVAAPHWDKDKPYLLPVQYVGFSNSDRRPYDLDKINRPVTQVWYYTSWRWEREGEHLNTGSGKCSCKDVDCGQLGFYDLAAEEGALKLKGDFEMRMEYLESFLAKRDEKREKARAYRLNRAAKAESA